MSKGTTVVMTAADFAAPRCDFCASVEIVWQYPCRTFTIAALEWTSGGLFVACVMCALMIEARAWADLVTRCVMAGQVAELPVDQILGLTDAYAALVHGFRIGRTGPRQPVDVAALIAYTPRDHS